MASLPLAESLPLNAQPALQIVAPSAQFSKEIWFSTPALPENAKPFGAADRPISSTNHASREHLSFLLPNC